MKRAAGWEPGYQDAVQQQQQQHWRDKMRVHAMSLVAILMGDSPSIPPSQELAEGAVWYCSICELYLTKLTSIHLQKRRILDHLLQDGHHYSMLQHWSSVSASVQRPFPSSSPLQQDYPLMASGPHPTRRLSLRFNHSNGDIDIINLIQHNESTKYGGLVGGPTRRWGPPGVPSVQGLRVEIPHWNGCHPPPPHTTSMRMPTRPANPKAPIVLLQRELGLSSPPPPPPPQPSSTAWSLTDTNEVTVSDTSTPLSATEGGGTVRSVDSNATTTTSDVQYLELIDRAISICGVLAPDQALTSPFVDPS